MPKMKLCPRCNGSGQIPDPGFTGQALRQKRAAAKLSLRQLAKHSNISAAYLSDLELGRRGTPAETLKRIYQIIHQLTNKRKAKL